MPDPNDNPQNRCRLVLTIDAGVAATMSVADVNSLTLAGDIASVIFFGNIEEGDFQSAVEKLVLPFQEAGIAVLIDGQSRVAGRVGADGLQLGQDVDALADAIDKFSPKLMIGAGNVKTRHNALVIGELQPDYLMFGKPGGDIRPEPHPKNLDLGSWWSSMVEISCIVLGGNAIESALAVAKTGAEFVALGDAIFAPQESAREADKIDFDHAAERIRKTNEMLNDEAPRFEETNA